MLAESLCVSSSAEFEPRAAPLARLDTAALAARTEAPVAYTRRVPSPTGRQRRAEFAPGLTREEHRLARAPTPHDRVDLFRTKCVAQRVDESASHWHR
ncbi:hypothetical protein [Paraburkholderia tropica]|uniref:hypothetical protein n=1 Tax=Paraburkholderia tropica TaxID=92647 RepID=UPI002AB79CC9|nr:hypothetical protein [Paraburkholderia tropica]